jgi:hypothetical protein
LFNAATFNLKRGVYFLANNHVLDLTIAFLSSFRRYNANTCLCFIPYNDDCDQILQLQDIYDFEVFSDSSLLSNCDEISRKFHDKINGSYRKLAMWEGIFDEFIYIDIDTIVLKNVDFVYRYLDEFPCMTSHSNIPSVRKYVWKDSIYSSGMLDRDQIDYAANTGFISSKKGFISLASIENHFDKALRLKPHMELSTKPYSSLHILFELRKDYRIKLEFWAGMKGAEFHDGEFVNGHKYFLVHWAGCWQKRKVDFYVSLLAKIFSRRKKESTHNLHIFMPYKKFWMYYRNLNHEGRHKLFSNLSRTTLLQ